MNAPSHNARDLIEKWAKEDQLVGEALSMCRGESASWEHTLEHLVMRLLGDRRRLLDELEAASKKRTMAPGVDK